MPPRATTIAFDVMGSDHGPAEVVRGAAALSLEAPHIHALLVGDAKQIDAVLAETRHSGERISVHHAPEFVAMHEKPSEALGGTPKASVLVATRLVADGEADAVVTAGNTGAGVLACARTFQLIPGVRRAALASVYPTRTWHGTKEDPFSLILDVGATVDATAEDLVTFAVMGSAYAAHHQQEPQPLGGAALQRHRAHEGATAGGRGARQARPAPGHPLRRATSRASTSPRAPPTSSAATASSATSA